jgi:hexosaminidase
VIGVEGAMWGETVVNLSNVDYMVFPRLPALAEVAWSPNANRISTSSPAYQDFVSRLAAQGGRFLAAGQNFYPSTEVPWQLDLTAANVAAASNGGFSGPVATLAAPGRAASAITSTINWGDGTSSAGMVNGTAATPTMVNGLYSVGGSHSYAHPGEYDGTVTVSASGTAAVTARFIVRWTG